MSKCELNRILNVHGGGGGGGGGERERERERERNFLHINADPE